MSRLQQESQELRNAREVAEKNYMIVANDNNALQIKLENLEQLFIKNSTSKKNINQEYINCNLLAENKMIKAKIAQIEDEIFDMRSGQLASTTSNDNYQDKEVKVLNRNLKDRLEFLKKREMELMALIAKRK